MNFNGLDTHRKWLFSLIIVVKDPLVEEKIIIFKKENSQKYQNKRKFLRIFFFLDLISKLELVLKY